MSPTLSLSFPVRGCSFSYRLDSGCGRDRPHIQKERFQEANVVDCLPLTVTAGIPEVGPGVQECPGSFLCFPWSILLGHLWLQPRGALDLLPDVKQESGQHRKSSPVASPVGEFFMGSLRSPSHHGSLPRDSQELLQDHFELTLSVCLFGIDT